MRMGTPGSEQGQMVECSYGWHDGNLYRRTVDRSDGETTWYVADQDSADTLPEGYDAGGEDHPPDVAEWTPCDPPGDVMSQSGETLDGRPSPELVAESLRAEPEGLVPATLVDGVWRYVESSDRERQMRQLGRTVRTVYVR